MLGVTRQTLRNWDKAGKISVKRSPSNYRLVSLDEIARVQGEMDAASGRTKTLAYARCSTEKQRDNLNRQVERLERWCKENGRDYEMYCEIGSALNGSRKQVKRLIRRMAKGDVRELVIEYRDRLTRFGFDYFEEFCRAFGVRLVCLEETESREFEVEMVSDITGLVTSYSARLYGRRGGKNRRTKGVCVDA
jgi:predicted site-specific integrase-resolvase